MIFKFAATKILRQRWKQMIIARRRISLLQSYCQYFSYEITRQIIYIFRQILVRSDSDIRR